MAGRPVHGAELPAVVEVQGGPLADEQVQGSLYTRPEWKEEFRRDFSKIVVDKCSIATKEAIASNEDIKVLKIFISLEINVSCVYRTSERRKEFERRSLIQLLSIWWRSLALLLTQVLKQRLYCCCILNVSQGWIQ